MAGFLSKLKEKVSGTGSEVVHEAEEEEGYVELGADVDAESRSKTTVRPFVIEDFDSIKPILDSLREGNTIALINIKPLKDKDIIENGGYASNLHKLWNQTHDLRIELNNSKIEKEKNKNLSKKEKNRRRYVRKIRSIQIQFEFE